MKRAFIFLIIVKMSFVFDLNASETELSCAEKLRILSKQVEIRKRICEIQNFKQSERIGCINKVKSNLITDCKSLKGNQKISYTKQDGFLLLSIGESH